MYAPYCPLPPYPFHGMERYSRLSEEENRVTQEMALYIATQAIYTVLKVAAPMLIAGLAVGLTVALFQAVTQVHEMTLTFIPKILAVAAVLVIALPWMLDTILSFVQEMFAVVVMISH